MKTADIQAHNVARRAPRCVLVDLLFSLAWVPGRANCLISLLGQEIKGGIPIDDVIGRQVPGLSTTAHHVRRRVSGEGRCVWRVQSAPLRFECHSYQARVLPALHVTGTEHVISYFPRVEPLALLVIDDGDVDGLEWPGCRERF